jgi:hypothetical protein
MEVHKSFLFIGYENNLKDEIRDFIYGYDGEALFADSTEHAIHMLEKNKVDVVVLALHRIGDAAILNYINLYFPKIKVLIKATHEFDTIFQILNKGNYSLISDPMKLKELISYC